ncbi:MAG: YCF48-related protein [Tunicatimonas sp.]
MPSFRLRYALFVTCCSLIALPPATGQPAFRFSPQVTATNASLRGLSVVDGNVAWASGSGGTVLRTTDGGTTWQQCPVRGADSADFRSLYAFNADEALVLSAGTPALLYHTTDGGATWQLRYENRSPDIFFDALSFWNATHGVAMSDPIDGQFVLIVTHDGGQRWKPLPTNELPPPASGEAGFAASGTGVVTHGNKLVWFATGGTRARVFRSGDQGVRWTVAPTPMQQGTPSQGIFSLVFADSLRGVAVGGNYLQPADTTRNACFTTDGGRTWQLPETSPKGYRSAVAYHPPTRLLFTVGPSGSDYSTNHGRTWQFLDTVGYHTVRFAPEQRVGWVAGSDGRIARIGW